MSVSCSKFLEPKSTSEFIPKNVTSLDEMLINGAYYRPGIGNLTCFSYLELFTDDVMMTTNKAYFLGYETSEELAYKKIVAMTGDVFNEINSVVISTSPWQSIYDNILEANAAIDYLPRVSGADENKYYVEAQALFLRALGYFYLVNYYGEPYSVNKMAAAVPLKLTSNLVVDMVKRNSVEEVYNQIVKDLLRAQELWEMIPERQFKKNYRANLPATQFLLSKVYLFMENWSEAKKYSHKVINDWSDFSLYNLNTYAPSASKANLDYATYDNSETIWMYGSIADFFGVINRSMTMEKVDPADENEAQRSRRMFNASSSLIDSYGDENVTGDLRLKYYMFTEWVTDKGAAGYIQTKLPLGKVNNGVNMLPISGNYNPALKFRLSEMYLTYAEACAMIGGSSESEAIDAINSLRRSRIAAAQYTPISGLTGADLLEYIKAERRRELCFEGSRWFDMRRWGMKAFSREWRKFGEVVETYDIGDKDPSFTFPLAKKVMDGNTALTQNPLSSRIINE